MKTDATEDQFELHKMSEDRSNGFLTELTLIYYNAVNKKQKIQFETKGLFRKLFILLELVVRYRA